VALLVIGCGLRPATAPPAAPSGAAAPAGVATTPTENLDRLTRLHEKRRSSPASEDYVLGAGDVVELRAFGLEQMNQRVRVDGDGTITLPLLNAVPVAGRTLAQVQRDLTRRLGGYMYDPSVTVFVEEYRSQQVVVVGAVQRPGLVPVTTRDASVFDALSAAGGTTAEAGSRIYLVPSESRASPGDRGVGPDAPIVIDTAQVADQAQRLLFTLPVRAGDLIVVPARGNVVVMGWVEKPGTYPLHPGLTLRGALGTAGGLSFAARTNPIRIHRPVVNGASETREVDYGAIAADRAPDISLYEGDVVEVESAPVKLVPYGFYKLFTDLFRIGARVTP
jgi:polysaccharide biosynthesis/export protein